MTGALKRAARYHDGWMPSGPEDSAVYAEKSKKIAGYARDSGRDPAEITGSAYLTLAIGDDDAAANAEPADASREEHRLVAVVDLRVAEAQAPASAVAPRAQRPVRARGEAVGAGVRCMRIRDFPALDVLATHSAMRFPS